MIVNVTSTATLKPLPLVGVYRASKAAVKRALDEGDIIVGDSVLSEGHITDASARHQFTAHVAEALFAQTNTFESFTGKWRTRQDSNL